MFLSLMYHLVDLFSAEIFILYFLFYLSFLKLLSHPYIEYNKCLDRIFYTKRLFSIEYSLLNNILDRIFSAK